MQLLKDKILTDGYVLTEEILKVDSFLNHQIDPAFMVEIGQEFYRIFSDQKITKVVTIEASGIAIGVFTALAFNVPLVFAKKTKSRNLDKETYCSQVHSFTKNITYDIQISKKYLSEQDRVIIVDDFLANGQACLGLIDVIRQSKAKLAGIGIVIEKGFQPGGAEIRQMGINLQSLAIIENMNNKVIKFA